MHPILFDLGTVDLPLLGEVHLALPTYGVLFAAAVLVAWTWFLRRARSLGLPEETLFNLAFFTVIGGILGAKVLLVAVDWQTYWEDPWALLGTLRAAGVLMGGVLGGALTFVLYARAKGLPVWTLGDALAAPLALAQAFGRFGCFAAGCCWGVPTHAGHPLAVVFNDPQTQARPIGRPLIATQLLEAVLDIGLAVLLTVLWRRRPKPPGTVFWWYLLLYSIGRGTIEFWRGDVHRGIYFGTISTSQLLGLIGILIAIALLIRGRLAAGPAAADR